MAAPTPDNCQQFPFFGLKIRTSLDITSHHVSLTTMTNTLNAIIPSLLNRSTLAPLQAAGRHIDRHIQEANRKQDVSTLLCEFALDLQQKSDYRELGKHVGDDIGLEEDPLPSDRIRSLTWAEFMSVFTSTIMDGYGIEYVCAEPNNLKLSSQSVLSQKLYLKHEYQALARVHGHR